MATCSGPQTVGGGLANVDHKDFRAAFTKSAQEPNAGPKRDLLAPNVSRKASLFAGPGAAVCRPLHLQVRLGGALTKAVFGELRPREESNLQ
jgi:hypothetical protein